MVNLLLILSIFLFVPILGIPDAYDFYIYIGAFILLCLEWLRLWKTKEIFRKRVERVKIEIKQFIKSFFKEEDIVVSEEEGSEEEGDKK